MSGVEVEGVELGGVVEVVAHGVGELGVLVQDGEVEAVGPPVLVAGDLAGVVGDGAVHGRGGFGGGCLGCGLAVGHGALHFV